MTISGRLVGCHGGLLWIDENFVPSAAGQTSVVVASTFADEPGRSAISCPVVRAKAGYMVLKSPKSASASAVGAM